MQRHFTVTAFVSAEGATLLHWHAKNRMWLPPGGHIEPDEDPLEAALRETMEETGIAVTVLPISEPFGFASPRQLPAPVTIMVESIPASASEPAHEHLDLIYFTRPQSEGRPEMDETDPSDQWRWVDAAALRADAALPLSEGGLRDGDRRARVSQDVRVLGLAAIERAAGGR
ncbi:MAG: NUDIX domain-containing protein [Chloroflexi bacterium]|nr:NUDIX domain-containing protein [Chloroflexota bacterium]